MRKYLYHNSAELWYRYLALFFGFNRYLCYIPNWTISSKGVYVKQKTLAQAVLYIQNQTREQR